MKRKTHEEFVKEMNIKNKNIIILEKYINCSTKIEVKCKNCNYKWKTTPNSLVKGHSCPYCANNIKKTHEEFVNKMLVIAPTITVIGKYKKITERINVKCLNCGKTWNPLAYSLLVGKGCPHCSAVNGAKKHLIM